MGKAAADIRDSPFRARGCVLGTPPQLICQRLHKGTFDPYAPEELAERCGCAAAVIFVHANPIHLYYLPPCTCRGDNPTSSVICPVTRAVGLKLPRAPKPRSHGDLATGPCLFASSVSLWVIRYTCTCSSCVTGFNLWQQFQMHLRTSRYDSTTYYGTGRK